MSIKFKVYKMVGRLPKGHAWHLPILWIAGTKGEYSITIFGICFVLYIFNINNKNETKN